MALFSIRIKMAAATILDNFEWPYLRNRSSDPLCVLFQGGIFGDGGSNGAISGSNKFNMASAAIQDNFEWPYLRNTSRSTYIARIARSSLRQHSFLVCFVLVMCARSHVKLFCCIVSYRMSLCRAPVFWTDFSRCYLQSCYSQLQSTTVTNTVRQSNVHKWRRSLTYVSIVKQAGVHTIELKCVIMIVRA